MLNSYRPLRQRIAFFLTIISGIFISIILFPFLIIFALIFTGITSFLAYKNRPKKGTIEILPAEKKEKMKSTKDEGLEITIEALQRHVKEHPAEPKNHKKSP